MLRTGAAAMMAEQEPEWLTTAKAKLDSEDAKIKELYIMITQLRLALKRSKKETTTKAMELANAQVRAAMCARRRATLSEKLNTQKVEIKEYERENAAIVEAIEDLKEACQGYVPYEGEPYEEFVPAE